MRVTDLFILTAYLMGLTVAAPHVGMVDTLAFRDVGVVFKDTDYQGESTFLLMGKTENENQCRQLAVESSPGGESLGLRIQSLQICWPTACTLFTGENCSDDSELTLTIYGPHDAPIVQLPGNDDHIFKSYVCGLGSKSISADVTWEAQTGHDGHYSVGGNS